MTQAKQKDVYELTPAQQAILCYSKSAPASQAYFQQICYALRGPLDVSAFTKAWQRVIDRHSSLRTSFYFEAGPQPVQRVAAKVKVPFVQHDWRSLSVPAQTQRLALLLAEDRRRGFDLAAAPLIRLTLIRIDEESYRFVFSSHHIIMDSWSMSVIRSEASQFYKAGQCGAPVNPEPPGSFGQYVDWLRQQTEAAESDDFWARELSGFDASRRIAIDRTLSGVAANNVSFAERETDLPVWLTADLQSFAGSIRLTMSTLIQGAWAVLLSRYCRSDDVVFGFTTAGRPAELNGAGSMVGLFTNIQPRRVLLSQADSILSYFKHLQTAVVIQREHEYCSLDRIQDRGAVTRGLTLCESLVVFENFNATAAPLGLETSMEAIGAHLMRTSYPLVLLAHPGHQMRLQLIYHHDRFADEAVEKMLGNLSMMLEDMVENPTRSIDSLELLHNVDLNRFAKWNAPRLDAFRDSPNSGLRLLSGGERRVS